MSNAISFENGCFQLLLESSILSGHLKDSWNGEEVFCSSWIRRKKWERYSKLEGKVSKLLQHLGFASMLQRILDFSYPSRQPRLLFLRGWNTFLTFSYKFRMNRTLFRRFRSLSNAPISYQSTFLIFMFQKFIMQDYGLDI